MKLYHYTCVDHGQPGIERDGGLIRPRQHPWLPEPLAWFTDLDVPHREALGLTSYSLSCDRTAVRYEVHPAELGLCMAWTAYARTLPTGLRDQFESAPGALPRHWWVSRDPLIVFRKAVAA